MKKNDEQAQKVTLLKTPTGIQGLDEITYGGLPKGRTTLVCGNAGCGKTLFGMEFLVRGATQFNEPGVFMSFEETSKELTENVTSLGFDLDKLTGQKLLLIDHVYIERSEIEETGEFNLDGLFIRLSHAIDSIGAKRLVLDTIESIFSGLPNPLILRAELRRLFRWLKDKGVTAIITGERGDEMLTRQGLEEYVSDCVIVLDHRVKEQASTRRLRVVKYRGSLHGTNEYPFLIDESGFSVLPITSIELTHTVSSKRVASGVPRLDAMLNGKGYFCGSSIMVSGTTGTGKSSLAAHFVNASCQNGDSVIYFSLEESQSQIIRNMRSIGIDLEQWVKKGLLKFHSKRASYSGVEAYLAEIHKVVKEFKPQAVVLDTVSSFVVAGNEFEAGSMLMRLIDFLKLEKITTFMTCLTSGGSTLEKTSVDISSLVDTWLLLKTIEIGGERNRGMYVLKSRGMAHSNQIREFVLTDHGVELLDVYVGQQGVLTGSSRIAQEVKEKSERLLLQQEVERQKLLLDRKRKALEAQILLLRTEFEANEIEAIKVTEIGKARNEQLSQDRSDMAKSRNADEKKKQQK